jgi:hypothetical protein
MNQTANTDGITMEVLSCLLHMLTLADGDRNHIHMTAWQEKLVITKTEYPMFSVASGSILTFCVSAWSKRNTVR